MDVFDFYRNFKEETFDDDSCLLCGKECSIKTKEHIFPKWLQHRFNLWDQTLEISNGTTIPYRYLTVPCCSECNNIHLSKMEEKFKELVDKNFRNLSQDDEKVIFQWTAKILYATRYKELSLLIDRAKPDLGKILSPYELESYSTLHLFLQSIRFDTEFREPKPWSIFKFICEDDEFFYHNSYQGLCFSMKFGKTAVFIAFEDNNWLSKNMHLFKKISEYKLNFIQYLEVSHSLTYAALLKEKVPQYITTFTETNEKMSVTTMGNVHYREWNDKEYCFLFDLFLKSCGYELDQSTYRSDGLITSFLVDENNEHLLRKYIKE